MIYIEVIYSEDLDSYELRLVDDSYFDKSYLNNSEEHWYAKVFEFSDLSDIQETQNP